MNPRRGFGRSESEGNAVERRPAKERRFRTAAVRPEQSEFRYDNSVAAKYGAGFFLVERKGIAYTV